MCIRDRASRSKQASWGAAVDAYLERRTNLCAVVCVMDARRPLQPFDTAMLDWSAHRGMPLLMLLNKTDKLKQSQRAAARKAVDARIETATSTSVCEFSAQTGAGSERAIAWVTEQLRSAV